MNRTDSTQKNLERIGEEFLVGFLNSELDRHPNNHAALAELATLFTKAGRFQEGLEADRRLAALCPGNPVIRYNLACSYALVEKTHEALAELEKAIELGYNNKEAMLKDKDLLGLHKNPNFQKLLNQLR